MKRPNILPTPLAASLLVFLFLFSGEAKASIELVKNSSPMLDRWEIAHTTGKNAGQPEPHAHEVRADRPETHTYHNPAGCRRTIPLNLSPDVMLESVQSEIAGSLYLEERRVNYIWNGPVGTFLDITDNPYVHEFEINEFQPPFTYQADEIITSFVQNGFVVWLRAYSGAFRLLAISMIPGPQMDLWGQYITAYWQKNGIPADDSIVPVAKKLPCHWMVDGGYVSDETAAEMFGLDWHFPDYLAAGRRYLADSCQEAYRISQEKIGYWDATSMCGPLTWQILQDANSFPYRIGSYNMGPDLFIGANPRYGGRRPWSGFDPETYDLIRIKDPMAGYDFGSLGELNPGDIIFSFGSPDQWAVGDGHFSHIFLVAGLDQQASRLAVTNLVQNQLGVKDCSISEIVLYTPGDREHGVINCEWNDHGYGITGSYGFDVFRWKWISYHLEGLPRQYSVRRGETVETIAFDWKVSPQEVLEANHFIWGVQLDPGQVITLPAPMN